MTNTDNESLPQDTGVPRRKRAVPKAPLPGLLWDDKNKEQFREMKVAHCEEWEPYLEADDYTIFRRISYGINYQTGVYFARQETIGTGEDLGRKRKGEKPPRRYCRETVGNSATNLETLGIINRSHKKGDRRTYYSLNLEALPTLEKLAKVYPHYRHVADMKPTSLPTSDRHETGTKEVVGSTEEGTRKSDGTSSSSLGQEQDQGHDDDGGTSTPSQTTGLGDTPGESLGLGTGAGGTPSDNDLLDKIDAAAKLRKKELSQAGVPAQWSWVLNRETFPTRMKEEATRSGLGPQEMADAIIWFIRGIEEDFGPGYIVRAMSTIPGEHQAYLDHQNRAQHEERADSKAATAAGPELAAQDQPPGISTGSDAGSGTSPGPVASPSAQPPDHPAGTTEYIACGIDKGAEQAKPMRNPVPGPRSPQQGVVLTDHLVPRASPHSSGPGVG
jgi:hypothetical protein